MWTVAGRVLRRICSGLGLLALLVGLPTAQVHFIGWPLPRTVPSWEQFLAAATSRDWLTDANLIRGLSVALWIAWALFVISVIDEVIGAVTDRHDAEERHGLRLPTRGLAAALVAGLTATVLAGGSGATAQHPQPQVVATAPASPVPAAYTITVPDHPRPAALAAAAALPPTQRAEPVRLAARPLNAETPVAAGPVYEVAGGDWLWYIADRYLADPHRYRDIAALNPQLEQRNWRFPDHIEATWQITLPADAHDRGPREHATGHLLTPAASPLPPTQTPPEPTPTQPATPDPATTAPTTATPTPATTAPTQPATADEDPDGVIDPPPGTGPGTASPTAPGSTTTTATPNPTTSDHDDPGQATPTTPWIQVIGGFVTAGLAAGLLYAVTLVWRRRRHRYQPGPITATVRDDPDLIPPLAACTRLRQAVRSAAPHLLDEPDRGPTVREYNAATVKPPLPPVGPTGPELATGMPLPVEAGVGLDGSAATDAARAMLVATLAAGRPSDPHAQCAAVVPADTLTSLLGVTAVDLGQMRRLAVPPTFAEALFHVEEEILRRRRLLSEYGANTVEELRAKDTGEQPLPQLLLIAEVPDEAQQIRLVTALGLGEAVGIGAVLLGTWPHGTTLTVAADGATGNPDTPRLTVLDIAATAQMLTMLGESHGDRTPPPPDPQPTGPETRADQDVEPPNRQGDEPPTPPASPPTTSPGVTGKVRVRVLGEPAILDTDGAAIHLPRAKCIELVTYLAVNRGGAATSDITEALYPDSTLGSAAKLLQTALGDARSAIRSILIGDTPVTEEEKRRIEPIPNTVRHYHLHPALLDVDWWTVQDARTRAATAADDTSRLTYLRTAIDAIRGGLADGKTYDWIETDREHVRRELITIHTHAADLVADTDPHQARLWRDQACELDPLSDELARRAMHAAATLGDADAIRHRLNELRHTLVTHDVELDVEPETEQLAETLLRHINRP